MERRFLLLLDSESESDFGWIFFCVVTSVKFSVSLMPQHQYTRYYIKFGNNSFDTVSTSNVHTQMLLSAAVVFARWASLNL
jgi:hypothetical protein